MDYEGVRHTLADWQGFGGPIYFHLLLKGLAEQEYLMSLGEDKDVDGKACLRSG